MKTCDIHVFFNLLAHHLNISSNRVLVHVNTFDGALLMELNGFEWNIMVSILPVLLTLDICQYLKKGHLYL